MAIAASSAGTDSTATRVGVIEFTAFACALLEASGLSPDRARDVAEIVVEGELFGKTTHGIVLLARYVDELANGGMTKDGGPIVLQDRGACLSWDARKLPGPWIVLRSLDAAIERAGRFGIGAVTFQRSHHLACLGAYLQRATDRGYMMMLTLIDASHSSVAPFGGLTPVLTSNPIAFGAPTEGAPIMIDMTTSLLSNGMVALHRQSGMPLPRADMMDGHGRATTDAAEIAADPPGSILPIGGMASGHKGYSIGLMVELLTGCLSGRGRADPNEGWSASAFLLVIDPAFFGGREDYLRQVSFLSDMIHGSRVRPGFEGVVLPGEHSLARRERSLREGLVVPAPLRADLRAQAAVHGVPLPAGL